MAIKDNQRVEEGELLFEIDPTDYVTAAAIAQSTLDQRAAEFRNAQERVVPFTHTTMVRKRPEWSEIDVFAFPLSVITRIPRPRVVKMALTSGRNMYCK